MRGPVALVLSAVLLAGCGSSPSPPKPPARRLVDLKAPPPYVNALELDATSGDFLLTTNRGFWRVSGTTGKVTRIVGKVTTQAGSDTVGTFLEIVSAGNHRLLGSGHPDHRDSALPQFLGLLQSTDDGATWTSVSRLGDADLHKILLTHNRLYAIDAVLGALLISGDGGRTFLEKFTPRGLVVDFAVDPADRRRVIAATDSQLFRSDDEGDSWRPLVAGTRLRLAWASDGTIYRADADGSTYSSTDRAQSWQPIGKIHGEPYKLTTTADPKHLYLALSDATILETTDGARTWTTAFKP